MDFRRHDIEDLAGRVRAGEISSRELTEHALARIEASAHRAQRRVVCDEATQTFRFLD